MRWGRVQEKGSQFFCGTAPSVPQGPGLKVLRLLTSAGCSGIGFRVAFSLCPLPPALSHLALVGRGWRPAVGPEGPHFL